MSQESQLPDDAGFSVNSEHIINDASDVVVKKEVLTIADVFQYLSKLEKANDVLLQNKDVGYVQKHSEKLHEALNAWDTDRSMAFLYLLIFLNQIVKEKQPDQVNNACYRCCKTIVQQPLIPNCNPEQYWAMVITSANLADMVKSRSDKSMRLLYSTYHMGVQYNARRFSPDVLPDKTTQLDIIKDYHLFTSLLEEIRHQDTE